MTRGNKLTPDQSGGANRSGQQGESQSSAPPLVPEVEEFLHGIAPRRLPGPTKLPPLKVGVGNDDGDNPHNPGARQKY